MKRDAYSNQQSHASFQPRSPQSAIDPTQLSQPVHHSSSTSDLGANWLNKASNWMADKLQTAQNFVSSGDEIAPDQILPALKGTVSPNQPLVGVIDSGFGANEHGRKMVEAIQKENPQAQIWKGDGVGTGNWSESLVEFVDTAKAGGHARAVANLSFDLTEVHPDGSTSTRTQLTAEEQSALTYARDNGVLVVASSGNQGGAMSALGQASQASDNLIVVGAANGSDSSGVAQSANRAAYSSYGNGLDLVADVGSAGTSAAAANVTGAIANIWNANPELTSQQVNQILTATATDLNTPGRDAETGAGLLNSTGAIDLATHTTPDAIVFSGAQLIQPVPESLAGATWESRNGTIASERTAGFGDWVHGALDVAGFIPGVGAVADVANAALYAAKGDYANAAMSAAAAVPGIGDAAAAVKLANRGVQAARAANRATRAPVPIRPRPSSPPHRPPTRPASSGASGRPASNLRPPQRQTGGASTPRPPQRQTVGASTPRPPQRQTGGASTPRPPQRQTVGASTPRPPQRQTVGASNLRPPQRQTGGASTPRQNANPQPHARGDRQPDRFSTRSQQGRNQQIREYISETSTEALASMAEQYAGEIPALQGVMDVVGLFGGRRGRAETPRGDRQPVAVGAGNGRTRPSNPSTAAATPGATTRDRNSRADSPPAPRSGGSGGGNKPPRKPPTGGGHSTPWWEHPDPGTNFVTDDLGRTTLAVHRVDGPHPSRAKEDIRHIKPGDMRLGDHKGHLGAENLVDNTDRVNNSHNIVAESKDSNTRGSRSEKNFENPGKRNFEWRVEQAYRDNPDSKIYMVHEPLYQGTGRRPTAITHSIMNDKGEVLYEVTIFNKEMDEDPVAPDQGGTRHFRRR